MLATHTRVSEFQKADDEDADHNSHKDALPSWDGERIRLARCVSETAESGRQLPLIMSVSPWSLATCATLGVTVETRSRGAASVTSQVVQGHSYIDYGGRIFEQTSEQITHNTQRGWLAQGSCSCNTVGACRTAPRSAVCARESHKMPFKSARDLLPETLNTETRRKHKPQTRSRGVDLKLRVCVPAPEPARMLLSQTLTNHSRGPSSTFHRQTQRSRQGRTPKKNPQKQRGKNVNNVLSEIIFQSARCKMEFSLRAVADGDQDAFSKTRRESSQQTRLSSHPCSLALDQKPHSVCLVIKAPDCFICRLPRGVSQQSVKLFLHGQRGQRCNVQTANFTTGATACTTN